MAVRVVFEEQVLVVRASSNSPKNPINGPWHAHIQRYSNVFLFFPGLGLRVQPITANKGFKIAWSSWQATCLTKPIAGLCEAESVS
jgi:hypothetical protein